MTTTFIAPEGIACETVIDARTWPKRGRRGRAFKHFHWVVCKGEHHDLDWLAGKLGLPPGDERLPEVALKLGQAGKLGVYINREGRVGEVGWPRKKPGNGG